MGLFSFLNKNKQDGAPARPAARGNDEDAQIGRSRARERKSRGASAVSEDPLLPEKKRARRRLLGAIALVIAVVIGLPMALDPEPKPLADDIAIQIPSRDKPAPARAPAPAPTVAASLDQKEEIIEPEKSARSAVAPGSAASSNAASPNSGSSSAISSSGAPPGGTPPATASTAKAPVNHAAASKHEVEPIEASTPPSKPVAKATVTPPRALPPEIDDSARARAILDGKPDTKAVAEKPRAEPKSDNGNGKVVLQVAALATQEKITEVQNKLKSVGINSYTQKISTESGPRTRIRIIAANPEEAARLRAKLAKVSLSASAVAPNP